MHALITEFMNHVQNAARYIWVAVIVAWLFSLGGWVFVSQMPDRYQANARVHVDTRSVLRPLLNGLAIQPDVSARVRLMSKLMFSRPNLEKVARMTDLDLGVKNEATMEALVGRLQSSMTISGGESDMFTIGFQDPDPKVAKKVVQALLTIFVEQALGESREDSSSAQKFLDQQIKEYETRLQIAEKSLEDYKRTHYGLLPRQNGDLYQQLSALGGQADEAKMALQEAINRRDELKRQLGGDEPVFTGFGQGPETATPLDARIQSLQSRLDDLLLKYTKGHPEVVALKKSLADLERQRAQLPKVDPAEGIQPSAAIEMNPVFQQLRIALSDAEANVASLSSRTKTFEERMEILKKQMDDRLKVETELQGLNRDYMTVKDNYNQLLKRRETAKMSENVEQNTDTVKFRIVDPPQVPAKPSAPRRIVLSTGVLFAGIGAGLAVAIFLSLLRPAFTATQKLREVAGLPVLGSVSMNWMPEVRKQELRRFLGCVAAFTTLLIAFAGVVALEVRGYHLPPFI